MVFQAQPKARVALTAEQFAVFIPSFRGRGQKPWVSAVAGQAIGGQPVALSADTLTFRQEAVTVPIALVVVGNKVTAIG